ncbi:transposase [Halomonas sp. ATCH28]|uniref:Transposase n=1 Tax=Halomonas gemina TaxID=2945105 RepID=A0ABT0T706_9GAMM|nr:transposase [Halomonas gemina]MCL7942306.1 transposase [Halomonas gemina]
MASHLVRDDDERGGVPLHVEVPVRKEGRSGLLVLHRRQARRHQEDGRQPHEDAATGIRKAKASIRAKVEHPFHVIKNLFGYRKLRYKGLAKNQVQLFTLFALGNLVLAGWCQ